MDQIVVSKCKSVILLTDFAREKYLILVNSTGKYYLTVEISV
jgi:hypothetical protein